MLAYISRRLGQNLVTLFLIVTLAFFLVQAQPGDYTSVYAQDPKTAPGGPGPDTGQFRLGQTPGRTVPGPPAQLFHRQLRGVVWPLPAVRDGGHHRAAAPDRGPIPHGHGHIVLHRVRSGEDPGVAAGRVPGIQYDHLRGDPFHRIHPVVCPDDDLAIRLSRWDGFLWASSWTRCCGGKPR